jgi:hypothetical protein
MIEFKLFKTKTFTSSVIIIGVVFFAYMPISYLMNFYLENQLGYSVLKAGSIIGIISGISFFMAPIFGLISKKFGARVPSALGIVLISLGNFMFFFMNSSNNLKIIYSSFILVGIGLGATTPLYQSAFEEISENKNGIASGILNSFRQLTACLAIALVSTLSSHYTAQAIDNTKARIIDNINSNQVLEEQVKDIINSKILSSNSTETRSFSKEAVDELILAQEQPLLASASDTTKMIIQKKFSVQANEIYKILDEATIIKNDESNKVYNKSFLITSLIALLGLIAVPFNKKKIKTSI